MPNILKKCDLSLTKDFGIVGKPKREKFNWATGGTTGEFRFVSKRDLNIEGDYQREEVSHEKVAAIARGWDWLMLGTVSVVQREDESLWVFDGGHRVRASFYRDDVDLLPCMVHLVETISDEAKAFFARNTMYSVVSSLDRHRAALRAGEDTSIAVDELLKKNGLVVSKTCSTNAQIKCIGKLRTMVEVDIDLAERVLGAACVLADDKPVTARALGGLFLLCFRMQEKKGIDILTVYASKFETINQSIVEMAIHQRKVETGKGGEAVSAQAILGLLNKSKRRKLAWVEDSS